MSAMPDIPVAALRRLAQGLLYDRHRAEDVVQEAWLAALRAGPPGPPGPGLGGWLTETVKRLARNRRREEARRRKREEQGARVETVPGPADLAARIEILRKLLDAVEALEEPYRSAVALRYLEDLPPREIARRMGVPVNTARTHVRRGLERLRARLDGERGRGRQEFLAALAPCAGKMPWTLALGLPAKSLAVSIGNGALLVKNKALLAAAVAVVLGVSWVAYRGLQDSSARPGEAMGTLNAPPVAAQGLGAPSEVELEPAGPSARAPVDPGPTALSASWVVRGHVTRGNYEPYPEAQLLGRVFAGAKPEGTPLLEARFSADSGGDFAWSTAPPAAMVTVHVEPAMDGHLGSPTWDLFMPDDPAPDHWKVEAYPFDGTVQGTVRNARGEPVAGARIAHPTYWGHGGGRETTSGTDGRFTISCTSWLDEGRLDVSAEGFARARIELDPFSPGATLTRDVILVPELRIHGLVVDESGSPIAGAQVSDSFTYERSVLTDAQGRFEIGGFDPEAEGAHLFARREGFIAIATWLPPRSDFAEVEHELKLERGVPLSGRVLDPSGQPVAGVWVSFHSHYSEPRNDTWTDAEGRFTLEHVSTGEQRLWLWRTGLAQLRHDLEIPITGLDGLEIVLPESHFIGGIVLGADGGPLAWTRIVAEDLSYEDRRIDGFATYTGPDGRFRIDGFPAQPIRVSAYARGYTQVEQVADSLDRDDLVLRPEPAAILAGRVVDAATGEPIPSFVARVLRPQSPSGIKPRPAWMRGVPFSTSDGVWRLEDRLESGQRALVQIDAPGYAPATTQAITARDPDPDAALTRLVRGTSVRGRVVEVETSLPVAGARVRRLGPSISPDQQKSIGGKVFEALTGPDGRFELVDIPAGAMTLAVEHGAWAPTIDGPFEAGTGERWIELGSGSLIRGRLLDAEGNALSGQPIELWGAQVAGDRRSWNCSTDANGSYSFAGLPGGTFQLSWTRQEGEVRVQARMQLVLLRGHETKDIDLQPRGHATVCGTLRFDGPLPEIVSVVADWRDPSSSRPWSDRRSGGFAHDGQFEIPNLEPGTWSITAWPKLGDGTSAVGSASVDVPEEGTVEVQVPVEHRQ